MTYQSYAEQLAEAVTRSKRYDDSAPYKQGEYKQDDDRADKTELFAHYGKDKVVLRLGQVQILLSALSETESEQAAGAYGIKAVSCLPSAVPHIAVEIGVERLTPAVHTLHGVGQGAGDPQQYDDDRENGGAYGKPLDLDARHIHHKYREQSADNDAGVMRLEQKQERG